MVIFVGKLWETALFGAEMVEMSVFIWIKFLKPQLIQDRIGSIKKAEYETEVFRVHIFFFMIGDSPG